VLYSASGIPAPSSPVEDIPRADRQRETIGDDLPAVDVEYARAERGDISSERNDLSES
jgi:hypothetical protein